MPDEPHAPLISLAKDLSRGEAEILRGLLEAQGVPAILSQEAAGSVFPVDVGAFGQVELLVPADRLAEARKALEEYGPARGAAPSSRE
jgi:hypothetical protein